ncbi:hypothetical protein SAY86_024955 [Trapa natans]|uniref:Phytocyanin domain-containing protein n=1 Tax=Trapa natans TaxID=22666 RepID=A0AAN7M5B6_TRANT|nr:hypothetical protein SAY86_024955 [Trapa natans]
MFLSVFSYVNFVSSAVFEVGGKDGWTIPKKSVAGVYNQWASDNRFRVNDIIHFTYDKDSVMEVDEEGYEKCRSTQPLFYSNNGDTSFTLDRPGLFYFISGVSGHCERGQKMIIKVLEPQSPPPSMSHNSTTTTTTTSGAADASVAVNYGPVIFAVSMFFVLLPI